LMQELEATWGRILRVWWLIFWRGIVGGAVLGGVGGIIAGVVCSAIGHVEQARLAASVVGGLLSVPWGVLVTRMALTTNYGGFRIALVPREVA
jgi:hypothetical protein